jgi:NADPH:quinone reductase-like Zn-dependent oxidoreductase
MRAVIFEQHGPIENLKYVTDFPDPAAGPGEVRVRLRAAALNRLDLWVREGWPGIKLHLPHIPGADGAGDIDQIGEGVTDLHIGDRVVIDGGISCGKCNFCLSGRQNLCATFSILGEHRPGTYAEYVVVPARNVLKMPEIVSYEDGAAASLVYLTAWHSLITRGKLQPGETVLIVGAGGGVNTASIQIATFAGAQVIVVGSAGKLADATALGADAVIDRSGNWSKAVFELTGRRGIDVVVDNVGKETLTASIRSLRRGGRLLIVGNTSGPIAEVDLRYIFSKQISIIGSTMAPHEDFLKVMHLVFSGELKPVIGKRFPLAQAADAQKALAEGDVFGKIVLTI